MNEAAGVQRFRFGDREGQLQSAGMPNWNQIHIFSTIPGKDPTARNAALGAARNEIVPGGASAWKAEFGISPVPRADRVRRLFELAVR
jgi:hypothetical protein